MIKNDLERKLIITHDLIGLTYNGGIGTAFTSLAEYWARQGNRVTIFWPYGPTTEVSTPIEETIEQYDKKGIEIIVAGDGKYPIAASTFAMLAYRTYEWLIEEQHNYDMVIGHEWIGAISYIAQGRASGLIKIPVVCNVHSPAYWHYSFDRLMSNENDLITDAMERNSIRFADLVVTPSAYMKEWLLENGYNTRDNILVIPNQWPSFDSPLPSTYFKDLDEIVFFGRQDGRKGLVMFCETMEKLFSERTDFSVSFLGKEGYVKGELAGDYLSRVNDWPVATNLLTNLNQKGAIEYLAQPHRLTVICSEYENSPYVCLESALCRLPFIARSSGGIPEMINPYYLYKDADELLSRLNDILDHGMEYPDPLLITKEEVDSGWKLMEEYLKGTKSYSIPTLTAKEQPKVSVIITHYERPKFLKRCLKAWQLQTYNNYEIIVVDDHSDISHLKEITELCKPDNITLVRHQENRYLGYARNTGIRKATGDFIIFCDDDNIPKSNTITQFVTAILTSGADIVTTPLSVFSVGTMSGSEPTQINYIYPFVGTEPHTGFYGNLIGDATMIVSVEGMKHYSNARTINWFSTERTGHEDWQFLARAILRGKKHLATPESLIYYYQSPDGMLLSGNKAKDFRRNLQAWEEMDPDTYYGKIIMEVAFSSNIQRNDLLNTLRNMKSQQQPPTQQTISQPRPKKWKTKKTTKRGRRG